MQLKRIVGSVRNPGGETVIDTSQTCIACTSRSEKQQSTHTRGPRSFARMIWVQASVCLISGGEATAVLVFVGDGSEACSGWLKARAKFVGYSLNFMHVSPKSSLAGIALRQLERCRWPTPLRVTQKRRDRASNKLNRTLANGQTNPNTVVSTPSHI